MLTRCGVGMGLLGLTQLLSDSGSLRSSANGAVNPLAPKPPHFPAKAKRVIHLFANGGPSQVDTFDNKPSLTKYAGKTLPTGNLKTERKTGAAFASPFKFEKRGQCGLEVSELFAQTVEAHRRHLRHPLDVRRCPQPRAVVLAHEHRRAAAHPAERRKLGHVWSRDREPEPAQASSRCVPAAIRCRSRRTGRRDSSRASSRAPTSIASTRTSRSSSSSSRTRLLPGRRSESNSTCSPSSTRCTRPSGPNDPQLEARIQSFELAYRMQIRGDRRVRSSRRSRSTFSMPTDRANRPGAFSSPAGSIERGVRFVQVSHGPVQPWDSHDDLEVNHRRLAGQVDQADRRADRGPETARALRIDAHHLGRRVRPHAGRGAADAGANAGKINGRDHNHWGFTVWLAGGGVKGGQAVGATDEFGLQGRREQGPRPRSARDDPAPARLRSREVHLSLRRPRLPPDRRARPRREGSAGVRVTTAWYHSRAAASFTRAIPFFPRIAATRSAVVRISQSKSV